MKRSASLNLLLPLTILLGACASFAEDRPPTAYGQAAEPARATEPARVYSQAELDQLLAPIALYPDALLSQILMATTYPLEVVQAARWSRAHPQLEGQAAVKAVEGEDWDPSVKSLVAFPQVLHLLDEKLEWTQDLGDAFLAQRAQVMDSVQRLRQRALDAGNLQSNTYQRVEREDGNITIRSAAVDVVHVPYYDPRVAYGHWLWVDYPPVYWSPWPGYRAYAGTGFYWSTGIFVGPRFFFGFWDWPHRHVIVVNKHVHVPTFEKRRHKVWRHDPHRRHSAKHRRSLTGKFFAPPHVRLRPDLRHDSGRNHRRSHEARKWDGHSGRRFDQPGRQLHVGPSMRQRSTPGLGPRHDRATQWPGLSHQQRAQPSPRIRLHEGSRHRGISRNPGGTRGPKVGIQPRFRVNAPQIRAAPRIRSHARGTPRSSGSALRAQGAAGRALSGARLFNGFRR